MFAEARRIKRVHLIRCVCAFDKGADQLTSSDYSNPCPRSVLLPSYLRVYARARARTVAPPPSPAVMFSGSSSTPGVWNSPSCLTSRDGLYFEKHLLQSRSSKRATFLLTGRNLEQTPPEETAVIFYFLTFADNAECATRPQDQGRRNTLAVCLSTTPPSHYKTCSNVSLCE